MCTNKVYIKNKYRQSRIGNYFACGRCPACLQAAANRRANKIRHHKVDGYIPYFITLTYKNEFIPYVDLDELRHAFAIIEERLCLGYDLESWPYCISIYRDNSIRYNRYGDKLTHEGKHELTNNYEITNYDYYPIHEFKKLGGLRSLIFNKTTRKNESIVTEPNKISVCYTPDAQNFLKRLRINLQRDYNKNIPLSYYYAPEYGPTTQRFHIHLLIWFPSFISEAEVKRHVIKAWPYADDKRTAKYIQIARNPSNYVASYVNSSSDVSAILLKTFPLRPSHSLHFGFDQDDYSFPSVFENYKRGCFTYVAVIPDGNGVPVEHALYYPKYVINRYFPKFKGYNRLNSATLRNAYTDPEKYFKATPTICSVDYEGRPLPNADGECLYMTNLIQVDGRPLLMYPSEINGTINRINHAYETFFAPLHYSRDEFANLVIGYHNGRFTAQYRDSQTQSNPFDCITDFINLCDLYDFRLENETAEQYLDPLPLEEFNPNTQNKEIMSTYLLTSKYDDNIKQRQINSLYSV